MNISFLKKVGQIIAQGVAIIAGVGPLVNPYLGSKAATVEKTIEDDLTAIGQVVVMIEAVIPGEGTGAEKLKRATPLIATIIKTSQLLDGNKIVNPALFQHGCEGIASGMADVLNSISAEHIQTSGEPPPAPAPAVPAVQPQA